MPQYLTFEKVEIDFQKSVVYNVTNKANNLGKALFMNTNSIVDQLDIISGVATTFDILTDYSNHIICGHSTVKGVDLIIPYLIRDQEDATIKIIYYDSNNQETKEIKTFVLDNRLIVDIECNLYYDVNENFGILNLTYTDTDEYINKKQIFYSINNDELIIDREEGSYYDLREDTFWLQLPQQYLDEKIFNFGGKTTYSNVSNKCGFVALENPNIDIINGDSYSNISLISFSDSIYNDKCFAVGGIKNNGLNRDVIEIDLNNPSNQNKLFEIDIDTDEQLMYYYYNGRIFCFSSRGSCYIFNYINVSLDYNFKDVDGSNLKVLTDRLPIKSMFLSYLNSTVVKIDITYIDNSKETIEYIFETVIDKYFSGYSLDDTNFIDIGLGENDVNISTNTNFYPVLKRAFIPDNRFEILLYKNSAEENRVDKTGFLKDVLSVFGVLRDNCSITYPVIEIANNIRPYFNYVYIPEFNRYYYLVDAVSTNNGLWELHLTVDTLMTYKDAILGMTAFVDRNEFTYNEDIIDTKRVIVSGVDKQIIKLDNDFFVDGYYEDAIGYVNFIVSGISIGGKNIE